MLQSQVDLSPVADPCLAINNTKGSPNITSPTGVSDQGTSSSLKKSPAFASLSLLRVNKRGKRYDKQSDSSKTRLFSLNEPPKFRKHPITNVFRGVWSISSPAWIATNNFIENSNELVVAASLIGDSSNLGTIFDQYRITFVELALFPRSGPASGLGANPGFIIGVVDYDDNATLASTADALDYSNAIYAPVGDGIYCEFVPRCNLSVGNTPSIAANSEKVWIDAASLGVQHYGFKVITSVAASDALTTYDLLFKLHVEWRCQR